MALQAGWNFKPQKKPAEPPEFTGNQMRTLDVEMFLDATDEDDGRRRRRPSTLLFATVRPTEKSIEREHAVPADRRVLVGRRRSRSSASSSR